MMTVERPMLRSFWVASTPCGDSSPSHTFRARREGYGQTHVGGNQEVLQSDSE